MSGIPFGDKLNSKKARISAVAVTGIVVLTGALVAVGVNVHADRIHQQQIAAQAVQAASFKASIDRTAADRAAADAAAKAVADKALADRVVTDKAAADKAAADKAAADAAAKAAADKALADRAAAAAKANRDAQRQALTPTAPATTPSAPATKRPTPAPTQSYAPVTSGSARAIAQGIVPAGQFGCFDFIISRESGWNIHATNPSSGAYGLPQALPGSKMASAGPNWQNDAATQIRWALSYMDSRYGSPCGAESFWQGHGWY